MAEFDNLHTKIDLVFRREILDYERNGRIRGGLGSFNVGTNMEWIRASGRRENPLAEVPVHDAISSQNASILLRLYASLDTNGKAEFTRYVTNLLIDKGKHADLTYLAYFVLFKVGDRVNPLLSALSNYGKDSTLNKEYGRGNLLAILNHVLKLEYDYFTIEEVAKIERGILWIDSSEGGATKELLIEVQMKSLELELDEVNPEINSDRDKVITFWQDVFGTNEVQALIDQVEDLFSEGAFDDVRLAECLSRVRVLLIDAMKRLSTQFTNINGLPVLADAARDADVITWFGQNGILRDEEKKLVRAVYNLCSVQGSHAASSKREYARIAKNVTYESILMLIGLTPRN